MTDAHEHSQHAHVFRPGRFREARAYWLDGAVLRWRLGIRKGHVQLAEITSMRINMHAGSQMAATCVLVEKSGQRHRLSDIYWARGSTEEGGFWGRVERREATFKNLTFTLARRLKKANPEALVQAGPGRVEWLATCIIAAFAAALVIIDVAFMAINARFEPAAAAFMGLVAIQLPLLWPIVSTGGPRLLDPETLHNANPPAEGA